MKSGMAPLLHRMTWARNALLYGVAALAVVTVGATTSVYSWLMLVPFVFGLGTLHWVIARGKAPRSLAQVGYAEVFYSTVFTVVAIVAF